MRKPKCICLDIDDTLLDFIGHLCTVHNNMYGTNYKRTDITDWSLPEELRKTFKDYENWIYTSQPVLPKVIKQLQFFRDEQYSIILMTARDELYRKHTIFNLALNGIKFDELFFNKNKSLKLNRLAEKYNIHLFADDKIETVNKVRRDTDIMHVFLINTPANRNEDVEEGIIRINNIYEIKGIK